MQVNANTQANMQALIDALKGISGDALTTDTVKDVSVQSTDTGLTITFNAVVDGELKPVILAMTPELDPPEGSFEMGALEDLMAKLDEVQVGSMTNEQAVDFMKEFVDKLVEKIQANGGLKSVQVPSSTSTTGSATLFNLLEVLSLLVEVGQEIKKSAKTIKASDNEMQAQSYERAAELTKAMAAAAKDQSNKYLAISITMMVVSACVSVGAGVYGATRASLPETKAAGSMSKMSAEVNNMDINPQNISTVTTKAGVAASNAIGADAVQAIQQSFSDPSINAARSECITANTNLTNRGNELQTAKGAVATAENNLTQAQNNQQAVNNNPNSTQEQKDLATAAVHEAESALATAKTTRDNAQQSYDAAKGALAEAKQNWQSAVNNVMGKYTSAYTGAAKSEQSAKYNEMVVAHELGMKMLKGETIPQGGHYMTDVEFGKVVTRTANSFRAEMRGESHWKMQAAAQSGQFLGQLATILSQHWQSEVNYEAQSAQADAQRMQAESTRKQNEYDEDKNLESSGQNIIDAAHQTMAKLFEGEHETNRQIFS
jgi:hypothetical protein